MDKDFEAVPLLLLLREIEHLRAQIQLMEICINEAKMAAQNENTRVAEEYRGEAASLRASLTAALENAAAEKAMLRARIRELELAACGAESSGQRSCASGAGDRPRVEGQAMYTQDDDRLPQDATELPETRVAESALEQSLRQKIERLLHEADEKNRILQDRNDELVRVKAELDQLHERLGRLESAADRMHSGAGESERAQAEFQAHVAFLQAELSQKQWALEEKQAAAQTLEQKYRQEIEALRHKLAERDRLGKDTFSRFPAERVAATPEPGKDDGRKSVRFNGPHQRWRSERSWKRRWRVSPTVCRQPC